MSSKIYTKTGDDGTTGLFGGARLPKDHIRIEAYGTVDELNAVIGWLMSTIPDQQIDHLLQTIQSRLFTVGSNLASEPVQTFFTAQAKEVRADVRFRFFVRDLHTRGFHFELQEIFSSQFARNHLLNFSRTHFQFFPRSPATQALFEMAMKGLHLTARNLANRKIFGL